jgi:hypothetical protein
VCLLRRDWRAAIFGPAFRRYNALLFLAVLPVYWLSPATIPRYLFMLIPLGLTVVVPLYQEMWLARRWQVRWLDAAWLMLLLLTTLGLLAPPMLRAVSAAGLVAPAHLNVLRGVPDSWLLSLGFFALLALGTYLFWRLADYRLLVLAYYLLVLRLAFDVFIFPARIHTSPEVSYRTAAMRVGRETKGRPLVLWPGSLLDNVEAFYISRERGEPLITGPLPPRPGTLYLADERLLRGRTYRTLDTFVIDGGLVFRVVEF